jgi:hypothetical protein
MIDSGMPEKSYSGIGISTVSQLYKYGVRFSPIPLVTWAVYQPVSPVKGTKKYADAGICLVPE